METFRLRLNCVDHYQGQTTRYDPQLRSASGASSGRDGLKVPIIRVFGSTKTGQKVCAHIHGAFPYLYVNYTGSLRPDEGEFKYPFSAVSTTRCSLRTSQNLHS
jgi:DNA polymerase zeta